MQKITLPCFERSSLPAEPFPCSSHPLSPRSSLPARAEAEVSRNRKTRLMLDNPPAKFARGAISRQNFQMPYKPSSLRQSFTNFLPLHSSLHLGSRQQQQQLNKTRLLPTLSSLDPRWCPPVLLICHNVPPPDYPRNLDSLLVRHNASPSHRQASTTTRETTPRLSPSYG